MLYSKKLVGMSLIVSLTIGGLSACNTYVDSSKVKQGSVSKKSDNANRPAEALTAYMNAGFYDKDIDKMSKLTGEDGKQFNEAMAEKVRKAILYNYEGVSSITEESVDNYFKEAIRQKVKFETNVVYIEGEGKTAGVEIKSKPILISSLRTKVEDEQKRILSENPSISNPKLIKQLHDYSSSILLEAEISSTEESVRVDMYNKGDDKWHINGEDITKLPRILYKP
ncbi:DUF5105 domain-containing protein [Bacillus pseudomycoides]|uniref:DUF5105 domain-containing protein n=2 Tax=Bacillus pseudomycoides TaxID=64104 RepID=UPI000BF00370|nr:DUF5105 domain-containing protein [Bacillus pseudomycoides]PEK34204.1 DUF5105 domain-containing protein [Bacillus pseudomycoides]PEK62396.1 DUF5105 domain-containing protein [Bacillus pseudomycoides]PEP34603.1 DUF5105 domain-containing protein [Bacillus pseudomycoides]PEP40670.1 DUF5105 domain-containing protein [Bacillus pseudomycoides]PFX40395.1 DUF5105 domain-containing protein [Bacillus pseudomycoides]